MIAFVRNNFSQWSQNEIPDNEFYKNMNWLIENKFVKIDSRYFRPVEVDNLCADSKKAKDNLRKVLEESVVKRLVSDVPIGAFLSGGIDSPLITAKSKEIKNDIIAYTISVGDKEVDESIKAKEYAKYLRIEHIVKKIGTPTMGGLMILLGIFSGVLLWGDFSNPYNC